MSSLKVRLAILAAVLLVAGIVADQYYVAWSDSVLASAINYDTNGRIHPVETHQRSNSTSYRYVVPSATGQLWMYPIDVHEFSTMAVGYLPDNPGDIAASLTAGASLCVTCSADVYDSTYTFGTPASPAYLPSATNGTTGVITAYGTTQYKLEGIYYVNFLVHTGSATKELFVTVKR